MRLAILADIHGNLPALEAVLDDVQGVDIDRILVAGDLTGGPQSQQVLDRLRALDAWCIRGNREEYLSAYDAGAVPDYWRESEQWAPLRWEYRRLDRAALQWIAALPGPRVFAANGTAPIRVVHGSPNGVREPLFSQDEAVLKCFRAAGFPESALGPERLDAVWASLEERVLICGHTHIAWADEREGRLILNPGSVGAPLNGDVRAQYALLKWNGDRWQVTHRAVPYDLERVRRVFCESGYLAEGGPYARAWLIGIETGIYVWGAFLAHARRLASEGGQAGRQAGIAGVWDRAVATFDWDRYECEHQ
jgi:predicted phosphodiesterase